MNRKFPQTAFPVHMIHYLFPQKKKIKGRVKHIKSCWTADTLVWLCTWSQTSCPRATSLKQQEDSPCPAGTGQKSELTRQEGAMLYRHKCALCGRVEAGAWTEPSSVSRKYTKEVTAQKNPQPTSRALRSFSHKHTFSISSCSVCMYSSSPCWVLHKPIRWMRPL